MGKIKHTQVTNINKYMNISYEQGSVEINKKYWLVSYNIVVFMYIVDVLQKKIINKNNITHHTHTVPTQTIEIKRKLMFGF